MPKRPSSRAGGVDFPPSAQIPVYLTPLVGRSREVNEVVGLLRNRRLVSLVGAGGSGKTRLAAEAATRLEERQPGSVAWIDLAALSDPTVVPLHAAATLGLREQPDRTATESLIACIGRNAAVLVLDNCEHLLCACSTLADSLLRSCPALRILTTSRQPLSVSGEKAWLVPPLALPAPGDASAAASGAVQLFVERAHDALPSFALTAANIDAVVRICRRLDGLPLAIELAAARVRLLPPEQLANRLDDAFGLLVTQSHLSLPRHRTLRALIDWSYDLLSPDERLLFDRLAVFAGGFTLQAVERVAGAGGLPPGAVLDLLASLVDKSLVGMREWHGEARYSLLETVRQYAHERLCDATTSTHRPEEVEEIRDQHALHFLDFVEQAADQLHGPAQLEWLARLDVEHENLRTALARTTARGQTELALRFCVALRDFWRIRGHLTGARHRMEEALRLPGAFDGLRARVLAGLALIGRLQGDYLFRKRLEEGEALARNAGDPAALANTLMQLGISLRDRQELDAARERLDEAISLWREVSDTWGLSFALGARASVALAQADLTLARALRLEAVAHSRRAGDRESEARALMGLGEVARLEGDLASAQDHNERCLELFRELGDTWHVGSAYHNLGWIGAETGRLEAAYQAFVESAALFRMAGNPFGLALCLFGFARLLHERGDPESAAVALATADAHAARVGMGVAAPADAVCCDRIRALVRAAVGEQGLARARAQVFGLELSEAISHAQQKLDGWFPQRSRSTETAAPAALPGPTTRPAAQPSADLKVSPDLCVRALGPLQIFLGERPLEGDAFGSSKPRELLLLLLCHPEGCTREQVGVAFWPESSAAQVKNSFHVTMHRLRKALEHPEWIVAVGDRYRLEPALRIDFDAACFEAGIQAALREDGAGADTGERLAAALALYRGDFLEGELVGDWHLEVRERLRRLYLDGLLAHGNRLMAAGRLTDAAGVFRSLLRRDTLHEEACRQLMICHERTGERVQALRLYESLSVLLHEELRTAPEPATTSLYERLQRAEGV